MKDIPSGLFVIVLVTILTMVVLGYGTLRPVFERLERVTEAVSWQGSSNPPIEESEREKPDTASWEDPG